MVALALLALALGAAAPIRAWGGTITYTLNATWKYPPTEYNSGIQLAPPGSFTLQFTEPTSYSMNVMNVAHITACSGDIGIPCGGYSFDNILQFIGEDDDLDWIIVPNGTISSVVGSDIVFRVGVWQASGSAGSDAYDGLFAGTLTATPEAPTGILFGTGFVLVLLGLGLKLKSAR